MITRENCQKHGAKLLKEAKNDMVSRKRSTDHNMGQALLDGVSHEVRQPMTIHGDPLKAFEHRKRNKIICCICGISAGTFYINNGESFCSEHKDFMNMDKRERELSKC